MAMSSYSDADLDFCLDNDINVLFSGKHGVGKTHVILEAFRRNNLQFAYFSGSTLDPWVDFVGVPRPVKDEQGRVFLDLVRPKIFVYDQIQAIFIDEYNRSAKKVRNAIMELIQFGTINGHPLRNLKVVWAAINPHDEDGTYDTEELDPAQLDRFQVHIDVPYKPSAAYFTARYGAQASLAATSWWNELPKDIKEKVSPRRLDYALDFFDKGGDINFILPSECNPHKLYLALVDGPMLKRLTEVSDRGDLTAAKAMINEPNAVDCIVKNLNSMPLDFINFWLPLTPQDNIMAIMTKDDRILFAATSLVTKSPPLARMVTSIIRSNDTSVDSWKILATLVSPQPNGDPSIASVVSKTNPYKALLTEYATQDGISADIGAWATYNPFQKLVKAYLYPSPTDEISAECPTLSTRYLKLMMESNEVINGYRSRTSSRDPLFDPLRYKTVYNIMAKSIIYDAAASKVDEDILSNLVDVAGNSANEAFSVVQTVNGGLFKGIDKAKKIKEYISSSKSPRRSRKATPAPLAPLAASSASIKRVPPPIIRPPKPR